MNGIISLILGMKIRKGWMIKMIPVYQDKWGEGVGNCFQATLASYFELELNEVPDFCNLYKDDWCEYFTQWLHNRGYGYIYIIINPKIFSSVFENCKDCYILGVVINNDGVRHSVIYKNGKIVHDPNFWYEGKYKVVGLDLFIPL